MQKYDKFLKNISELIEKSLFASKDLKKDASKALKYRIEDITNKLNLVSREEFEVQKKMIEKLSNDVNTLKGKRKNKKFRKKSQR
tara:strand:- start:70 stop:324 length:255 start_codon:yes stop_codon:yes gene_type:complete